MKVLLCTMTVGEGVNKICYAVSEQLDKLNIKNEIFDVCNNKKMLYKVSKRYYNLVKIFPRTLRLFQRKLCRYDRKLKTKKANYFVMQEVLPIKQMLQEKFTNEKYDVIYTPTMSTAIALVLLKKEGVINSKILYNIPDFNLPVNVELIRDIDFIITLCEEQEKTLLEFGFKPEQIVRNKIPISDKFLVEYSKEQIRKELSLDDKFTILIMSGGYGAGSNYKVLKTFLKYTTDNQIIVVNGKNVKQKQKIDRFLEKQKITNVLNLGFCTYIDKLMSVSNVLYSKVGAATMCEAFAKRLVFVTTQQMLYPEYDNLKHLKKYGGAIECRNLKECALTINRLKNGQMNIKSIQDNLEKILDTNSASRTANLIKNM